jgi:hypothetical protein
MPFSRLIIVCPISSSARFAGLSSPLPVLLMARNTVTDGSQERDMGTFSPMQFIGTGGDEVGEYGSNP